MLDAFGPTGADGIYSKSLQSVMSTLRGNRDTLLSVLEPFVKDPVIDWHKQNRRVTRSSSDNNSNNKESKQQKHQRQQEHQSKEAKRSINVIDERLQGIFNLQNPNLKKVPRTDAAGNRIPVNPDEEDLTHYVRLSVEGQAHKLIAEATSSENLVQLYVGWMPWV